MRIPLTTLLLLAAAACAGSDGTPRANTTSTPGDTTGARGGGATTAVGSSERPSAPAAVATREVYIDSVAAANPVVVYGRARTFENTVQVRLRDERGELLTETFTTSVGEMGHHNPFVARAWLTRSPGRRLIAEAFEYSAKDGSVRSLTADTVDYAVAPTRLTLYFPTSDCTTTAAFEQEAPRAAAIARLLVEALVRGPDAAARAAGATAPFPDGSRVNSVNLRDGVLTVDFNERLQNVGGSCAAQGIRASVTETLRRLVGVQRVVITAGGSADLALQP